MGPFSILALVVIVVAIVAITGIQPRGGRPVTHARLMWAARIVLLIMALVIVYFRWIRRA